MSIAGSRLAVMGVLVRPALLVTAVFLGQLFVAFAIVPRLAFLAVLFMRRQMLFPTVLLAVAMSVLAIAVTAVSVMGIVRPLAVTGVIILAIATAPVMRMVRLLAATGVSILVIAIASVSSMRIVRLLAMSAMGALAMVIATLPVMGMRALGATFVVAGMLRTIRPLFVSTASAGAGEQLAGGNFAVLVSIELAQFVARGG